MKRILSFVIVVVLLSGCVRWRDRQEPQPVVTNPAPASPTLNAASLTPLPTYWPTTDWLTSTPEEQGMDRAVLAQMLNFIQRRNLDLHSLLVIRHGYLVSENYFQGYNADRPHELYSCTKSFISTLVGIAIEQGAISGVEQPALGFFSGKTFENVDARKQAMTLENLLTMTSGLDWEEGDEAYRALYLSRDWVKYVLDLPMSDDPGSRFNYCTGCSHVLSAIITRQTGMPTQDFAAQYLFEPLGLADVDWTTDSSGISIGGWGLQLTPRQMARLGYLYLHNGNWDGTQVVPAAWVEQATRLHVETGDGNGYGYQWWIYPALGGYAALGRGGQTIFVSPDLDLVVVFTAQTDGHGAILQLLEKYLVGPLQKP